MSEGNNAGNIDATSPIDRLNFIPPRRPSSAAYLPQYHGWRLTTPGKTDPIFTSIHDIYHQNLLLMTGVADGREVLESSRKL